MKNQTEKVNVAVVIQSLEKQAKPISKKLEKLTAIKTQDNYDAAALLMKELKSLSKTAEKEMKTITDPINEALRATRQHFKPFMDRIAAIERETKTLMLQFVEQQKRLSQKVDEDFESGKIKRVRTFAARKAQTEVKNSPAAKVRKVWTLEIENESVIPREYLMPDTAKITEALRAGKTVKGCAYIQKETIAI